MNELKKAGESETKSAAPIQEKMESQFGIMAMESIIPIIKPHIEPTIQKIENYLGNNENIIVMWRTSDKKSAMVMSIRATGEFEISNDGTKAKMTFLVDHITQEPKTAINWVHNIRQFLDKMLGGKME